MAVKSISETERVRYLLGLSSPAEREHIESEYFESDDAFQEMLTAEDDLIDAYAHGELAGEEQRRFQKRFVSSLRGRDRIQFARAFGCTISATDSVQTKLPARFLKPGSLRIAAVIVLVALLAWLVSDRNRLTNELHELRTESAELSKRINVLQQSSETERTRTGKVPAQPAVVRTQPDKPRNRKRVANVIQRVRHLPEVHNDREKIASAKPDQEEKLISTEDTSITELLIQGRRWDSSISGGTTVRGTVKDPQGKIVSGATVTLTDSTRNFTRTQSTNEDGSYVFNAIPPGTYSIKVTAQGFKTASASDLALVNTATVRDVQLEVGAVSESVDITSAAEAALNTSDPTLGNSFVPKLITELPLNANKVVGLLSLQPGVSRRGNVNGGRADQANVTLDGIDITERTPSPVSWIRFRIILETFAVHEDYRVTIKTADGRPVTSVDWIEPVTPDQTIIDTPAISTSDLPAGDYVLLLLGKEPDGTFVKVAEYAFKVIKY